MVLANSSSVAAHCCSLEAMLVCTTKLLKELDLAYSLWLYLGLLTWSLLCYSRVGSGLSVVMDKWLQEGPGQI